MRHHLSRHRTLVSSLVPDEIASQGVTLRPGVQEVLDLVDTADPSWPAVAGVLREFTEAGIDLDSATVAAAVKLGKQRCTAGAMSEPPQRFPRPGVPFSIVYYARRGEVIKIGTTVSPYIRFREMLPDEILAVEPGGETEETYRHRQFDHLRGQGEHFRDAPELREHIQELRALHGEPDPSWPTSATAQHRRKWQLPPAASTETMTIEDAEAELGIKPSTVRVWVSRGRLQSSGRDYRNRSLFYREHLVALRDSTRKRRHPGS